MRIKQGVMIVFAAIAILAAGFYIFAPDRDAGAGAGNENSSIANGSAITGAVTNTSVADDNVFGGESENDYFKVAEISEPGIYSLGAGNSITLGEEPVVENLILEDETEPEINETAQNETEPEQNETDINETEE